MAAAPMSSQDEPCGINEPCPARHWQDRYRVPHRRALWYMRPCRCSSSRLDVCTRKALFVNPIFFLTLFYHNLHMYVIDWCTVLYLGCRLVMIAILDAFFVDPGLLKVMIACPTYSVCGIGCTLSVCSFVCVAL